VIFKLPKTRFLNRPVFKFKHFSGTVNFIQ